MREREAGRDGIERLRCGMCEIGWQLTSFDGRTAITMDRRLTKDEMKFLYARL